MLTGGIESLSMEGIFGSFLAFEKGPSHRAPVAGEWWWKQAHLSALLPLAARQIKGLTLRQRSCSLRLAELEAKAAFHL